MHDSAGHSRVIISRGSSSRLVPDEYGQVLTGGAITSNLVLSSASDAQELPSDRNLNLNHDGGQFLSTARENNRFVSNFDM